METTFPYEISEEFLVLILIVMEDTHGEKENLDFLASHLGSLNPYCNGRYSWRCSRLRMQSAF